MRRLYRANSERGMGGSGPSVEHAQALGGRRHPRVFVLSRMPVGICWEGAKTSPKRAPHVAVERRHAIKGCTGGSCVARGGTAQEGTAQVGAARWVAIGAVEAGQRGLYRTR